MAGDFAAILELIADIVVFVIKWTINLICFCVFLISFVLPWRFFEEIDAIGNNDDWRCHAFVSLFLTIFDVIAIPLGMISLSSFLRWPQISKAFENYSRRDQWFDSLFPLVSSPVLIASS
jgi:hypothetical protein